MIRFRLTIYMVYNEESGSGFDPVVLEFGARWDDGALRLVKELLGAYPQWEHWRLQRYDLNDVQSEFKR